MMEKTLTDTAKRSLTELRRLRGSVECMSRLTEGGDTRFEERLRRTKALLDATELALASLSDKQSDILREFYIDRHSDFIERICRRYDCSQSTVYRLKREALSAFATAMFGSLD